MKKTVVILPTYNEEGTIKDVIDGIFDQTKNLTNWEVHIMVVDSNSPDKTQKIVNDLIKIYPRLHLVKTKKEGLGKAYVEGFQYALDKLNPYVIFQMDADLSHDPKNIPEFLHKIEQGADFVIGARYIKGGSIPKKWAIHRKLFSGLGNIVIKLGFFNLNISDWTTGYRAIKAWIIRSSLSHVKNYSGYVFQVALLDHAIKEKAIIKEIPINFKDREKGISKINSIQYISHTLYYVFTHSSFVKFSIVGAIGFIIDFSLSFVFIELLNVRLWLATLISTETAIFSNFLLNNFWSFAHKKIEKRKKSYVINFAKFNFVASGSILIQTVGIHIFDLFFGRKWWYIYKIIIIIFVIIPYSYFFYNKFIWKEKSK